MREDDQGCAIVSELAVNGIWFGVLVVKAIEIGLLTPPVGINVFVAAGASKHVTVEGVFRAVTPLYLTEVSVILTLMLFPGIVTLVPDLVFGG